MKKYLALSFLILVACGAGCVSHGPSNADLTAQRAQEQKALEETEKKKAEMIAQTDPVREAEAQKMRTAVQTGKILAVGEFKGPAGTQVQGSARLVQLGTRYALAISEDFGAQTAADLSIELSRYSSPKTTSELNARGSLVLGTVKWTVGGQLFDLPAGTNVSYYKSAVLYSKNLIFAVATFK